jgi:putative tricarboxylic transport membrane protein
MNSNQRSLIPVFGFALILILLSSVYAAELNQPEGFPAKELELLVGWNPGSTSDRNARSMKPFFDKIIGSPLLVTNKPGASSMAAWNTYFLTDKGDAKTFIFTNWPVAYQYIIDGTAKYTIEDFHHLGGVNNDPIMFLKRKDDTRWKNFADFVKDCKVNPKKYKVSMTGPKSFQNLVARYVMDVLEIDFNIVNSPGGANEANQFLAGGHVDLCLTNAYSGYMIREVAESLGLLSNSKVANMWPEATPISEQVGKPLAQLTVLRGYAISKKSAKNHPERVAYLEKALALACTHPDFKKLNEASGESDVAYWIPKDEFERLLKDNLETIEKYKQYLK